MPLKSRKMNSGKRISNKSKVQQQRINVSVRSGANKLIVKTVATQKPNNDVIKENKNLSVSDDNKENPVMNIKLPNSSKITKNTLALKAKLPIKKVEPSRVKAEIVKKIIPNDGKKKILKVDKTIRYIKGMKEINDPDKGPEDDDQLNNIEMPTINYDFRHMFNYMDAMDYQRCGGSTNTSNMYNENRHKSDLVINLNVEFKSEVTLKPQSIIRVHESSKILNPITEDSNLKPIDLKKSFKWVQPVNLKSLSEEDLESEDKKKCPFSHFPPNKGLFVGNFNLVCLLGSGVSGRVVLAINSEDNKYYALKIIEKVRKTFRNILKKEKYVFEQIREDPHPFLIGVYNFLQTTGHIILVMEHLGGGTLIHHLSNLKVFKESDVVFYTGCMVLALDHLHSLGVYHRDIHLGNIILDSEGFARLIDYNLSEIFPPLPEKSRTLDYTKLGQSIYSLLTGKKFAQNTIVFLKRENITSTANDFLTAIKMLLIT